MPLQNRETLKNFFKKGVKPSESHFHDLIDSSINKVDDGMSKSLDQGLMLSPIGTSEKLISFFKSIEVKNPAWSLEIDPGDASLNFNNHRSESILSLLNDGKVGINNPRPEHELDVNGKIGMIGRVGTFKTGSVLGDGKWHKAIENLNGCHILEICAGIGKKKTGKYGLLHAFALSTYGKSKNKIQINMAYYGVRCNQIQLRWTGDTYNYHLEMRTRCSYGGDYYIRFNVSNLWFDQFMDHSLEE